MSKRFHEYAKLLHKQTEFSREQAELAREQAELSRQIKAIAHKQTALTHDMWRHQVEISQKNKFITIVGIIIATLALLLALLQNIFGDNWTGQYLRPLPEPLVNSRERPFFEPVYREDLDGWADAHEDFNSNGKPVALNLTRERDPNRRRIVLDLHRSRPRAILSRTAPHGDEVEGSGRDGGR